MDFIKNNNKNKNNNKTKQQQQQHNFACYKFNIISLRCSEKGFVMIQSLNVKEMKSLLQLGEK